MDILLNTADYCGTNVFFATLVPEFYRICSISGNIQNNRISATMDNVAVTFFFCRVNGGIGYTIIAYTFNYLDNKDCKKSK